MQNINIQGYGIVAFPDGMSQADIAKAIETELLPSLKEKQPPPTAKTTLRDVGIAGASGALGAAKSLTDVFGADNAASRSLGDATSSLQEMYTPERKKEMEYYQQLQDQAAKKGDTLGEVGAALQGIKAAPLQGVAQAVGSLIPNLATLFIPVAGEVKAAQFARSAINLAIGIAQGTGAVKGALYEGVRQELINNGVDEQTASERASKAQQYLGKNADQIIGGAVIGGLTGKFGAEELLSPAIKGVARKTAAVAAEAGTEAIQGSQEKIAENLGVQREGFDRPTFEGVAGAATQEGVLGALGAGPLTALSRSQPEKPAEVTPTPPPEDMGAPQLGYDPTPPPAPSTPELGYDPVTKIGYDKPVQRMPTEDGLSYGTATQEIEILKKQPKSPERDARLFELQRYKTESFMDSFSNANREISDELKELKDAIQFNESYEAQQDFLNLAMAEFYKDTKKITGGRKFLTQDEKDAQELAKQVTSLNSKNKRGGLKKLLSERLTPEDTLNIGPLKEFKFLATTNTDNNPTSLDTILSQTQDLDPYLPPELRTGVRPIEKEEEAIEYIRGQLRSGNYGTYDDNFEMRIIGEKLSQLDSKIKEELGPAKKLKEANVEAAILPAEDRREEAAQLSEQEGFVPDASRMPTEEIPTEAYEGTPPPGKFTPPEDRGPKSATFGKEELYQQQGNQRPEDGKWYTNKEFTAYANQPKSLKGFGKDKQSKTFDEQGYKNIQFVEVEFENGYKIFDAIRGLNKTHALARAFDNWTSAKRIRVLSKEEMEKLDPALFNDVKDIIKNPGAESLFEGSERGTRAHLFSPSEEQTKIEGELKGKSFMQMADWAIKNADNAFDKHFAQKARQRIAELQRLGLKFEFEVASGKTRQRNLYGAAGITMFDWPEKTIKITLNGAAILKNQDGYPSGMNYTTILHELMHAATRAQFAYKKDSPYIKELRDLRNKVVDYYNAERKAGRSSQFMDEMFNRQNNFLTNDSSVALDELLAWGITSRDAQKFLSEIKVGEKNGFSKLVEIIRKVLGINKDFETALDRLVRHTNEMVLEDIGDIEKALVDAGVISKQPKTGPTQESLFEQVGKPSNDKDEKPSTIKGAAASAAQKAKDAIKKAGQKRPMEKDAFSDIKDEAFVNGLEDTFNPETKTVVDKVDGMKDRFWQRLAQGLVDQFRTIKQYSEKGWMLSRMSKTVDGAVEAMMFYGHVFLDGGALNIKPNTKGLFAAMEPLGQYVDRYQMWVALNREAELIKDKYEVFDKNNKYVGRFYSEDSAKAARPEGGKIVEKKGAAPSIKKELVDKRHLLSQGKIGDKNMLDVFKQVQKDMNALNRSVLDVALEQGVIDKAAYEIFANDINFIPFYKAMENGDVQSASTASGLTNQYFSKALEGGEKQFGDLMENTLLNWSHILSASMKNKAASVTLDEASSPDLNGSRPNLKVGLEWRKGKVYSTRSGKIVGDGSVRPEQTTSEGEDIVKVMKDGKPTYYKVLDSLLLESVSSIGYLGPKSQFLDVARDFKNILQYGVTLSPGFKVRNLFRDSNQAMAVSDLELSPVGNVYKNWADSGKGSPIYMSALAGGAIFNFGSAYEGNQSKMVKRLIKMGVNQQNILDTPGKIKAGLTKAWDAYTELGNKSEAVNRIALYKQLRAAGKSHLEASFYARDIMDFSMQGAWPALRMVTQVVPFLNARLQGLYKLGRDGIIPTSRVLYNSTTGKPLWETDEKGNLTEKGEAQKKTDERKAHQFTVVTTAVMLASMALYLAFKDDEEFKKREEWDRDNFWWFRLPGMDAAVRVPKPFEIGAFGTMAERVLEQIIDQGAEGKQFEDSIKRMLSDTFAMNPTPQMIKPLIDLYANKDSFTGAPIETAGMERLSKAERASETTSPLGKALSAVQRSLAPASMEMSPLQIDYAIKAYFGWLGGTATSASHYATQPFSKSAYPDTNLTDTISMGFIKSLPATQSKYVTAFYENNKQISQAYADMRHYAELGEADKVREIMEEKGDLIGLQKFYDQGAKDMARMRQIITSIQHNETMSGAEKKEQIDRLKVLIGMRAEQLEDVRKSLKK